MHKLVSEKLACLLSLQQIKPLKAKLHQFHGVCLKISQEEDEGGCGLEVLMDCISKPWYMNVGAISTGTPSPPDLPEVLI